MTIIEFIDRYIKINEKGQSWTLSSYQRAVLTLMFLKHYAIRLWSEVKKSGKTFLAACDAIFEAFTHANTEVDCCANDLEQSQSRVFATAVALCLNNPELKASVSKITQNEIRFSNGSVIRAIASDYKGAAGGRQRLTIFDELWAYELERAVRLFEEMTPPATEPGAYILIVSYAGFTSEGELLENLYKRGLKGRRVHKTLECYQADGLFMFWSHKRRQPWQLGAAGRAYYEEQKRILRPNTFKRLHENEWVSSESVFILPEQWDACIHEGLSPILSGGVLYLGVDIGLRSDWAAVVAVMWHKDERKLVLANHRAWRPTKEAPVKLRDVADYILELRKRHRIARLYADPYQFAESLQFLQAKMGESVAMEFPQTVQNTTIMGEELYSLIKGKNLIAYPDPDIRAHVLNATGVETARGFRIAEEKASKKIDLAVALAMACCAALQAGKPITNPHAMPTGVGNVKWLSGRTIGGPNPFNPFSNYASGGRYQTDDD